MTSMRVNKIHQILFGNHKHLLITIIGFAVLIRIITALYLGDQVVELPGTFDQISYHSLALRVLDGHGLTFDKPWWPVTGAGEPTAHWSYLYTTFLTLVYAIFGPHPIVARLIQAVLVGVLQPYLAYLIASRIFNRTIGLAAAGLTAIYVYFVYYAGTLMTEPFYITALMASLYLAILLTSRNSEKLDISPNRAPYGVAIAFGLSLGIAVLLRQLFILILPFFYVWIIYAYRKYPFRQTLKISIISGVVVLAMILPFTTYNYQRFGEFVLLNTNAGYALFWGNHPIHGTQFIPILPMGTYQELIPKELLILNEAALDKALLSRGIKFVLDDPVRYLLLSISRIPAYFVFWPSAESSTISNLSRVSSFGILLPFMLYGLVRSFSFRRNKTIGDFLASPLFLLYLFVFIYAGIHLLSWALIRYRLPVDAVLLVFAGLAVVDLVNRIKSYLWPMNKVEIRT